jgi:hypothetical protein
MTRGGINAMSRFRLDAFPFLGTPSLPKQEVSDRVATDRDELLGVGQPRGVGYGSGSAEKRMLWLAEAFAPSQPVTKSSIQSGPRANAPIPSIARRSGVSRQVISLRRLPECSLHELVHAAFHLQQIRLSPGAAITKNPGRNRRR